MPEEAELKLSVRPDQAAKIGKHPIVRKLGTGRARTQRLVGTYFDTPDLQLKRGDLSLRVRALGKRHIQTLKRMKPSTGAVLRRDEWEAEVAGNAPEIDKVEDGVLRRKIGADGIATRLRPLFQTDVKRTVWTLREGGAEVELALDIGEIRDATGDGVPVCEAELELKAGDVGLLYDLAIELTERLDCTVSTTPKSDRGYALYRKESPAPVKASSVPLKSRMTVWQSFVAISRNCLTQLDANTSVAREGRDPEGVHQARIAIRRLRAAFKVFKSVLPRDKRKYFAKDLRWLQKQLGDARDLDVFSDELLEPMLAHLPEERALLDLRDPLAKARKNAYRRAKKALAGRRYGRLRLELERWLVEPPAADASPGLGRGVRSFARQSIRRAHEKMMAAGDDLTSLSEAELHSLRIRGKQARYCVEFFTSLFPDKGPRGHAKRLGQLQDCLGALNDSAVAAGLLEKLKKMQGGLDPRVEPCVAGWFAARIHDERANLKRIWRRLSALDAYWASR